MTPNHCLIQDGSLHTAEAPILVHFLSVLPCQVPQGLILHSRAQALAGSPLSVQICTTNNSIHSLGTQLTCRGSFPEPPTSSSILSPSCYEPRPCLCPDLCSCSCSSSFLKIQPLPPLPASSRSPEDHFTQNQLCKTSVMAILAFGRRAQRCEHLSYPALGSCLCR